MRTFDNSKLFQELEKGTAAYRDAKRINKTPKQVFWSAIRIVLGSWLLMFATALVTILLMK